MSYVRKRPAGGCATCSFCKNKCKVMTVFSWEGDDPDTSYYYESDCCQADLMEEEWKERGEW